MLRFGAQGAFGSPDFRPLAVSSPGEALAAVRSGAAKFAVVAIESSVDGPVTPTFDALGAADEVQIFFETDIHIAFSVMARPGMTLEQATTFSTHPVARQQVAGWLSAHAPHLEFIPASSNGAAAQAVTEGQADIAIAPARAAELFKLEELATGVADVANAHTRFVVVGKPGIPTPRTGFDRTSVLIELANEPGSLAKALEQFALRGVGLSRIESRPIRTKMGYYRFFVDLAGHIDDYPVAESLAALHMRATDLRFLGSWPAARADDSSASGFPVQELQAAQEWVADRQQGVRRATSPTKQPEPNNQS